MLKKQKIFLETYRKYRNVTHTCQALGMSRSTYYKWLNSYDDFKEEMESLQEEVIDQVENKLLQKIEEGDTTAIIFFLKTRAKHRGYTEKSEISHQMNTQTIIKIVDE